MSDNAQGGIPSDGEQIGMPNVCGMPALERDFGSLDRHALLAVCFLPSPSPDPRYQQFRGLLIFRMVKAARNYTGARAAVVAQITERQRWETDTSGGQGLPILEFSPAFDDCMSDLYIVARTVKRMEGLQLADAALLDFHHRHIKVLKTLQTMRSKSDHMDDEIEHQRLQGGPSRPFISKDGARAMLGPYAVVLADVARAIEDLFDALAATFPAFTVQSDSR